MNSTEMLGLSDAHRSIIEAHQYEIPVRLGSLAKALGISAIKVSSMKTGVSGQIAKEASGYLIRVNRNESRERQRFTIAHELSHFLLHRHLVDNSDQGITDNVLYRSGAPERMEYEANRLAADIVMPSNHIKNIVRDDYKGLVTEATIENLAARFEVSKAAMELRLEKLLGAQP